MTPEERELQALREILAIKKNKAETGDWENYTEIQLNVCVPTEYQYLEGLDEEALEKRKKRLEEDLKDLNRIEDTDGFNRDVELHRGRKMGED